MLDPGSACGTRRPGRDDAGVASRHSLARTDHPDLRTEAMVVAEIWTFQLQMVRADTGAQFLNGSPHTGYRST